MATSISNERQPESARPRSGRQSDGDAVRALADHAPGAIPPTEGVPPRSGEGTALGGAQTKSALEALSDGLELLRRATRALGASEPHIEALSDRAAQQLEQWDAETERRPAEASLERMREHAARAAGIALEQLVSAIESR